MHTLKGYKLLDSSVSSKTLKRRAVSYLNNVFQKNQCTDTVESDDECDPDPIEPDDECVPMCDPDPIEVFQQVTESSNIIDYDEFADSVPYFLEDDSDVLTDSDDDDEVSTLSSINEDIKIWAKQNFITTVAVDSLLLILRNRGHRTLPKSYKTLFGTQKCVAVTSVDPGLYYHFGVEKSLRNQLDLFPQHYEIPKTILLDINTDGLPISKSSGSQFWPILAKIKNIEHEMPAFVVGIYHGYTKPKKISQFLKDFSQETAMLLKEGIVHNNQLYKIQIRAYICDAPAKSFLTGTKGRTYIYYILYVNVWEVKPFLVHFCCVSHPRIYLYR